MITDLKLAQACLDAYSLPSSLPIPSTGTCVRVVVSDTDIIVAFRGSKTLQDWFRDFCCAPVHVCEHPQLGLCHEGFLNAVDSVYGVISGAIGTHNLYVTGHSLGGALAVGFGALYACAGRPIAAIVTCGAPRFGMQPFVDALKAVAVRQYRNGNDPVPGLPFDVPPDFAFVDTRAPIGIGVPRAIDIECHPMAAYQAALTAYVAKQEGSVAAAS